MINAIPLFSGSTGNSIYIKGDRGEYLIDAGVSAKRLNAALCELGTGLCNIRAIFITHEHSDHIKGVAQVAKTYSSEIYVNPRSARYVDCKGLHICDAGESVTLDDMTVDIFKTPHDSEGSVGYRFSDSDTSFGYCTDSGYVTREMARYLLGCKCVIFESNHDEKMLKEGKYPEFLKRRILSDHGHLSNTDCAKFLPFLAQSGAQRIILGHLSRENNRPDLAFSVNRSALDKAGFENVSLSVALEKGIMEQ